MIEFDVIVEIPKGERNKYEFDKNQNKIRLDRVLHSPIGYPADYGYIPNTLALDGDPLDVLILLTSPTLPGCLIKVKPIGVLFMIDNNENDEKIICVSNTDPNYNHFNNISDIPKHTKKEIEHFFNIYKYLEGKQTKVKKWGEMKEAIKIYKHCIEKYNTTLS
jgi:inorganic pyrophosphatase